MDEADSGRGSARLKGLFKVALSVAVTWLIFGEASAQQQSRPSSLPLQQAVTIAPEKNPLRKAAIADTKAASEGIRQARSYRKNLQLMSLEDAVVDAGAVRFRPMLLTAAAVVVGASVILFDPIFQGLALSLMAGEVASTVLSRMAAPVLYYLFKRGDPLPPMHPRSPENVAQCESPQCEVVLNSL
jgi:hypothetical protein